jgi:hypothetical protein
MKAKQRNRPVRPGDLVLLEAACNSLRNNVTFLRTAGAGNAANYVARALKSTKGALNNAHRMYNKQLREASEQKTNGKA